MTCVSGTSALDGPVDVIVDQRGARHRARGAARRRLGRPAGSIRAGGRRRTADGQGADRQLPGRPVAGVGELADGEWDRSVVVGEAEGRWLWLVLRPASAILLLRDDWILRDVSETGPQLVALPFGGPAPPW